MNQYNEDHPTNAELMYDVTFNLSETEDELKEAEVKFNWNKFDEIEIYSIEDEDGNDIEKLLEPDTIYEIIQKCKQYFS